MSTPRRKKPEVLVVAHDAGGAEIIAAYLKRHASGVRCHIYADGPAVKIFSREGMRVIEAPTKRTLKRIATKHCDATALFGTSWAHSIEFAALKEAKRQGLHTIAYLDSWLNYRERFGYPARGWRKNLPDEIWVGDKIGYSKAKDFFPHSRVRFVENNYFASISKRYKKYAPAVKPRGILFMSAAGRISEKTLAGFLKAAAREHVKEPITVRLHPSDERETYERILRASPPGLIVRISREQDIVRDIARARAIVGPETVALVPAVLLGKTSVRIVPSGEKAFLPFPAIRRVRSAGAALKYFRYSS